MCFEALVRSTVQSAPTTTQYAAYSRLRHHLWAKTPTTVSFGLRTKIISSSILFFLYYQFCSSHTKTLILGLCSEPQSVHSQWPTVQSPQSPQLLQVLLAHLWVYFQVFFKKKITQYIVLPQAHLYLVQMSSQAVFLCPSPEKWVRKVRKEFK